MQTLQDLATKRQLLLERVTKGHLKSFSEVYKQAEILLKEAMSLEDELSEMGIRKLNKFVSTLKQDLTDIFGKAATVYTESTKELAQTFKQLEFSFFDDELNDSRGEKRTIKSKKSSNKALQRPLRASGGDTVLDIISSNAEHTVKEITKQIELQASEGKTNREITRDLIGNKADKIDKSQFRKLKRRTEAMVRTANNATATNARHDLYEDNEDVVEGYIWISTLDFNTSNICRHLDGKEYKHGKGPLPPAHYQCRSTTLPKLGDEFSFLLDGSKRSALNGPIDKDVSYYQWLRRQEKENPNEVDKVLGKTRAKLFRSGGLTEEEFSKLTISESLEPLTLDEMRELEPEAFKKAKLN